MAAYHDFSRPRNYDARKGQEKGKVVFRGLQRLKPRFQVIDFKEEFGRGEWIRTTDLLVPNQALYQAEPRPEVSILVGCALRHKRVPSNS